jgi:hypothetical protein
MILDRIRAALKAVCRVVSDPAGYLAELRVRRRRHKLVMAYAKVGQYRHGLGGFSSLLYAYDRITSERLVVLVDGELVWRWPDDAER